MGIINLPDNTFEVTKYTWATKPSYAKTGDLIMITDIGPVDEVFKWTGSRWAPINGQCLLASTNTSVSVTGTVDQTELGTVTLPGGLVSANGILEVSSFWTMTNSANNKTIKIKIGQTTDPATGGSSILNRIETTIAIHQHLCILRCANSTSSQKAIASGLSAGLGVTTLSNFTDTYDLSTDKRIFLTGQLANTGETITLRGWRLIYKE